MLPGSWAGPTTGYAPPPAGHRPSRPVAALALSSPSAPSRLRRTSATVTAGALSGGVASALRLAAACPEPAVSGQGPAACAEIGIRDFGRRSRSGHPMRTGLPNVGHTRPPPPLAGPNTSLLVPLHSNHEGLPGRSATGGWG